MKYSSNYITEKNAREFQGLKVISEFPFSNSFFLGMTVGYSELSIPF